MSIPTIRWVNDSVKIIDQTKLPNKFQYIICRDVKTLWHAIKRLSVRGAPALGVAAAFGVLLGIKNVKGGTRKKFDSVFENVCKKYPSTLYIKKPPIWRFFYRLAFLNEINPLSVKR